MKGKLTTGEALAEVGEEPSLYYVVLLADAGYGESVPFARLAVKAKQAVWKLNGAVKLSPAPYMAKRAMVVVGSWVQTAETGAWVAEKPFNSPVILVAWDTLAVNWDLELNAVSKLGEG